MRSIHRSVITAFALPIVSALTLVACGSSSTKTTDSTIASVPAGANTPDTAGASTADTTPSAPSAPSETTPAVVPETTPAAAPETTPAAPTTVQ
jgi:hypothetical protein